MKSWDSLDFRKVALIIPAYQAEKTIGAVLDDFEDFPDLIVIVDDGSKDGTVESLRSRLSEKILLLRHDVNKGVGAAVKTGCRKVLESDCQIVVKVDSDGQMKAEDLNRLVRPLLQNEVDICKGNRWGDRRALLRMPWVRRLGNLGLSFLTRLASGQWEIFDPNNGYIAWRADWLRHVNWERVPDGFTFEAGMLVQSGITRAVVKDIQIPAVYGKQKSHLKVHRALFSFPWYLIRAAFHRIWHQYFLTDFNAVSLLLLSGSILSLFGILFGGFHWWISVKNGVPATAGTVVIAALPILMGFNCLLQALMIDVTNRPRKKFCRDLETDF